MGRVAELPGGRVAFATTKSTVEYAVQYPGVPWHRRAQCDQVYPPSTLLSSVQFEEEDDQVYLAYCFPYTYSDLQQYLALLGKVSQPKHNNTRSRSVGHWPSKQARRPLGGPFKSTSAAGRS